MLKETSDICSHVLQQIWNDEIFKKCQFPENLKLANITPVFKKEDKNLAKNYRSVSVLPTLSKIFEKIMQKQVINHVNTFLSPCLCGYRKGFSTQYTLLSLLEKWKQTIDNKGFAGVVLMDLSKVFDTLNLELLIAKLHGYGFGKEFLMLLLSYLSSRWQRTRINTSFSSWTELLQGVPQGSVLGPLLSNIYLNDLFFFLDCNVCNFADDTTPFICNKNLDFVLNDLELNSSIAIDWFQSNYMKMNSDKCHLLVAGHKFEQIWAKIGTDLIWQINSVKLL